MSAISPQDAQALARRWELVRDREAAMRRSASKEIRFRQVCALVASRELFGAESDRDAGVRAVRERWDWLRRAYGA